MTSRPQPILGSHWQLVVSRQEESFFLEGMAVVGFPCASGSLGTYTHMGIITWLSGLSERNKKYMKSRGGWECVGGTTMEVIGEKHWVYNCKTSAKFPKNKKKV